MNLATITLIIKLLDMVHDILCPFFNDNKQTNQDCEKILAKLDQLESLIIQKRDGVKNGKSNTNS